MWVFQNNPPAEERRQARCSGEKTARAAVYCRLGVWVFGRGVAQGGPVELQASESVLGNWLSGNARGVPLWL
jgi:hypothetical protein